MDIFFVISGYLITNVITEEQSKHSFSIRHFYGRRIRRIFPSLFIVLFATLLAGSALLVAQELRLLSKHVIGGGCLRLKLFAFE